MQQTLTEITGTVREIVYRNESNGYTVFEIADGEDSITAVGVLPCIGVGDSVRVTGEFTNHPSYGRQFSVKVCEICRPTQSADILRYLSSGAVRGVGVKTAQLLVEAFGESTLDVMENQPDRVARIKGISKSKALDFSAQLRQSAGVRTLMLFLGEYGISNNSSVKIYNSLGAGCVDMIKENPYILCTGEFGVSFENADYIARRENFHKSSELRVRAGLAYVLRHNQQNGHTCLPREKLIGTAAEFLEIDLSRAEECLDGMTFDRSLTEETFEAGSFIYLPQVYQSEICVSSRIKTLLKFPPERTENIEKEIEKCEREDGVGYAELQKEAITRALTEGILVLTGGPGTGKTTTLNAIIKILKSKGRTVLLAAPTGRAAQRISDLTGEEAKTLHRLLEVSWDKQDNPVFNRNERNQLRCDALIVDEVSMVDIFIFESLMRALPVGCRLILVGDSDQLPSVGPGNVLSDLIESRIIPVVRLSEIFRQARKSLIITNAHKILNGEMPVLTDTDGDFFFLRRNSKQDISKTVIDLCSSRLPKAYGCSVFDNLQVLAPSKKGELGTFELNKRLQETLNPKSASKAEVTIAGKTFRTGDKVMQVRNNYDIVWHRENGESGNGIFNGDIGIIRDINKRAKSIKVDFYDKTADFTFEGAADLEFAYAVTVHKSQGNEFDAVVIPMFSGPPQLYYRNLLYTAVTRAKKILILVGTPQTVEYMVNNNRRAKRYSGLRELLMRDD